jgi:hypothetical protein
LVYFQLLKVGAVEVMVVVDGGRQKRRFSPGSEAKDAEDMILSTVDGNDLIQVIPVQVSVSYDNADDIQELKDDAKLEMQKDDAVG